MKNKNGTVGRGYSNFLNCSGDSYKKYRQITHTVNMINKHLVLKLVKLWATPIYTIGNVPMDFCTSVFTILAIGVKDNSVMGLFIY